MADDNDSPLAGRELTNAAGVSDHLSVWETTVDSSLDDCGGVHDGSTTVDPRVVTEIERFQEIYGKYLDNLVMG